MNETRELRLGVYRHYKGGLYEVIALGTDEVSLGPVVIYCGLLTRDVWVRPTSEFTAVLENGRPRFTFLGTTWEHE